MKVLIVGSGGREHAIAASVAKSNQVEKIYCAPGNAGIGQIAECVDITAMEFDKLADFAEKNQIDLTIIGMDDPLVGGVVDGTWAPRVRTEKKCSDYRRIQSIFKRFDEEIQHSYGSL